VAQPVDTARLIYWDLEVDDDGYRTYTARYMVRVSSAIAFSYLYGPYYVSNEPQGFATNIYGLPKWGDYWANGRDIDRDVICAKKKKITPYEQKNDPHEYFIVECYFTNKVSGGGPAGGTGVPEYPRFSGGYTSGRIEAKYDLEGNPIINSVKEPVSGPQVEFDDNQPSVVIENISWVGPQLPQLTALVNKVNGFAPIWGLGTSRGSLGNGTRIVKCQSITWQEVKQPALGGGFTRYFTRRFEFEVGDKFDRDDIMDEGTQVLDGEWQGTSPRVWVPSGNTNFVRATDAAGNMVTVQLNGAGSKMPDTALDSELHKIPLIESKEAVRYYGEFTANDLDEVGINPVDFLASRNLGE